MRITTITLIITTFTLRITTITNIENEYNYWDCITYIMCTYAVL